MTRMRSLLPRLALAVIVIACLAGPQPALAGGLSSLLIDAYYDADDASLLNPACADSGGKCTLRAAIHQASYSGIAAIGFAPGLSGVTIFLDRNLGAIVWDGNNITLTGSGQIIDGTDLVSGQDLLRIRGNSNNISNLSFARSPQDGIQIWDTSGVTTGMASNNYLHNLTVIGNAGYGIYINGAHSGGTYNTIAHTWIGQSEVEDANSACDDATRNGQGVVMENGASYNEVNGGGIVCNSNYGVWIRGSSASHNQIASNVIGVRGNVARSNLNHGIFLESAAHTEITNNKISGNQGDGVLLQGATDTLIYGNWIGLDAIMGSSEKHNNGSGVHMTAGASYNHVGTSDPAVPKTMNVISGNWGCGISIEGGSNSNYVDMNYIGLSNSGAKKVPNGLAGLAIMGNSHNNVIGSTVNGVHQFISGNLREGIYVQDSSTNFIRSSNHIGLGADIITPRGNGLEGIRLINGSNNVFAPADVVYNHGTGIAIEGVSSDNNFAVASHIYGNGGLPVDLGNDGASPPTTIYALPGPNSWIFYPEAINVAGGMVSGIACPSCKVFIYNNLRGNPAAKGGGGDLLTMVSVNASGVWNYTLPAGVTINKLSFQTCQNIISGRCSELSPRPVAYLPMIKK